jgi:hypothetical protein
MITLFSIYDLKIYIIILYMTTLSDVTNSMIVIQELYILFFITVNKFLKLLQNQHDIYKHTDFYIHHINELLKEDKLSISKCCIFMIMTIYNENLSYRYQNNKKNRHIEKEIINEIIFILSNDTILVHFIKKINDILSVNLENYYHKYEEYYGCQLNINYNIITEIKSENIKDIYENFHKTKRLIMLSNLQETYDMEDIDEIDNYLFCLFYYNE